MFDIQIVNLDAGFYLRMTPEKDIAKAKKENKGSYFQSFQDSRRYFTPVVYSAEVIAGAEALSVQKKLAALLSYKLKQEQSEICGFVEARMSPAIVISNSLLLRGPRDRYACIWKQPYLIYVAVMALLS